MFFFNRISAAVALTALISASAFAVETWEIDPAHSTARFKIKHMMISNVSGEITGFKGTFTTDGKDVTKTVADVTLDAATINTNNAKRDEHLKSGDFFDTAKFSTIGFKSTKVTKARGGKFKMTGELTMHGVTKPVTFEDAELTATMKDPYGNTRRAFNAKTTLNRKDFGLTWNKALETGGVVVGDTVNVEVEAEMTMPSKKTETKGR